MCVSIVAASFLGQVFLSRGLAFAKSAGAATSANYTQIVWSFVWSAAFLGEVPAVATALPPCLPTGGQLQQGRKSSQLKQAHTAQPLVPIRQTRRAQKRLQRWQGPVSSGKQDPQWYLAAGGGASTVQTIENVQARDTMKTSAAQKRQQRKPTRKKKGRQGELVGDCQGGRYLSAYGRQGGCQQQPCTQCPHFPAKRSKTASSRLGPRAHLLAREQRHVLPDEARRVGERQRRERGRAVGRRAAARRAEAEARLPPLGRSRRLPL